MQAGETKIINQSNNEKQSWQCSIMSVDHSAVY